MFDIEEQTETWRDLPPPLLCLQSHARQAHSTLQLALGNISGAFLRGIQHGVLKVFATGHRAISRGDIDYTYN